MSGCQHRSVRATRGDDLEKVRMDILGRREVEKGFFFGNSCIVFFKSKERIGAT